MFERALNLVTPDGALVGLVGPRAGNGPAAIVLAELPPRGLGSLGIRPDDSARAASGLLDITGRLAVDLRGARRWAPRPARLAIAPGRALARVGSAERTALDSAPGGGLAPLLAHLADIGVIDGEPAGLGHLDAVNRVAGMSLAALAAGWQRRDLPAIARSAERLIGLGPGLTPSGDDLLAGLLIAASRLGLDELAELGPNLSRAAGRTTDISLARLSNATAGRIEEVQERVLTLLLDPPAGEPHEGGEELAAAVRRASGWGHTSGVDTLVGIFLGIRLGLG